MSGLRGDVFVTTDMTGKMEGKSGITTSCMENPICRARALDDSSVCSECYAEGFLSFRRGCRNRYAENFKVLNDHVLQGAEIPRFYESDARFEMFGDLGSKTHSDNFFVIANANPNTDFGWWSKNTYFIRQSLDDGYVKPKNLTLVKSSKKINDIDYPKPWEDFIDIVFTVWDLDYLKQHPEIKINCGLSKCRECGICYGKYTSINKEGEVFYVNEILKKDKAKYKKWIESR